MQNKKARKLQLSRETVRSLNTDEARRVAGGVYNAPIVQCESETVDFGGCCCTHLCGTTNFPRACA